MGDRTTGWLGRAVMPIARLFAAVTWVPVLLFGLLLTTVQLRWWPEPWGSGGTRVLFGVSVVLGVGCTVLYGLMAWTQLQRRAKGRTDDRFPVIVFNGVSSAVTNALFTAWSGWAMGHAPSGLLAAAVMGAGAVTIFGVAVLEFRRGWLAAKALRWARKS
jgi:hypothetical protein